MDSNNADILQIKKYLEGKLDARAMYELERRALDDPFLMDAMEGFDAAGNQSAAAADLAESLQYRLQKPKGRIISLSTLAMAASVVAVLTVGGWWLLSDKVVDKAQVVAQIEADKTAVTPSPVVAEPQVSITKDSRLALNTPKTVIRSARRKFYDGTPMPGSDINPTADEIVEMNTSGVQANGVLAEPPVAMRSRAKADSVPLNEMLVMGYIAQQKKDAAPQAADKIAVAAAAPMARMTQNVIKGKVTSAEDGQPLPGVNIRAGNSPNFAVTGADGSYTIKTDSLNSNLTYNYIGFKSRKLDAATTGIGNVAMEPERAMLNEVVVVNPADVSAASAYPKTGWESFQKYLNANSVSPNGKNKSYKVSFTVSQDGTLSNFEINKADNDVAGQKAIQLIKNGPGWVATPGSETKKITVTVKFHKPEK